MSKPLLQSKVWARFQESLGRHTFFIRDHLFIRFPLPLGKTYLYSPRPYFKNAADLFLTLKEAQRRAVQENAIFIRLEPENNVPGLEKLVPCAPVQPADSSILDLAGSERELLAAMKPKTRYNIRLALKHGVKVRRSTNSADIKYFWTLAKATAQRDQFRYHPRRYYEEMLRTLGQRKSLYLYLAEYKGAIIAAILVSSFGDTAIYLHGASSSENREVMAPYLLQWKAIRDAKKTGLKYYDFWGIAPEGAPPSHSWGGITRFKLGFGGKPKAYPGCFEQVTSPFWHALYRLGRRAR